ncbi:response regulator transcription factor [Defluviitalea saccharophila]|uniref:Stage 0 sporulation protein A homolog n=1 Tax=Defluviitalea saccharophila TaxID=879970 RepID=A0ABZ2Y431_9FIRM
MWKLLIADDEPRIRRGLKKSLNWEELDIEVIGEAEDGEMAFLMAKELQPDIMFVDINMPFLNGLQLIQKLNSILPNCIVIIITGYDEFSYVQQAIKFQVFDYLLKPVDSEELQKIVKKAIAKLESSKSKAKYIEWMDAQLKQNLHTVRTNLLNRWMKGKISYEEVENQFEFLKLNIHGQLGIFIIKLSDKSNIESFINQWDKKLLLFGVQNIVEELVQEYTPNVIFKDTEDRLVGIVSITSTINWVGLSNILYNALKKYLGIETIINQKTIEESLGSIPELYQQMIKDIEKVEEYNPVVLAAKRYIDTYYYKQDLTLGEVADKIQVSQAYLSKLLKRELGHSFVDYLTKVRVEKAIQFMNDPTIKIYEVAEQVGYNTQHYFSTAFKKVMGVSPIGYRGGKGF